MLHGVWLEISVHQGRSLRERGYPLAKKKERDNLSVVHCVSATLRSVPGIESVAALQVFFATAARPGITISELYDELSLPRSTVSRIVADLTPLAGGLGLVEYTDVPQDRRARALRLTRRGEAVVRRLASVFHKHC